MKLSIEEIECMTPFERDIMIALFNKEKEEEKQREENENRKNSMPGGMPNLQSLSRGAGMPITPSIPGMPR